MINNIPISKNEEDETPVPSAWRDTLSDIVNAIIDGNFEFPSRISHVASLSKEEASRISANIEAYGGELIRLPEEAWETSICRWMGDSWLVLVDLFTADETPSDLVLFVKIFEDGSSYRFQIESVHVP